MSLLSEAMQECVFTSKQILLDEYGGYKTELVDGAPFSAAIYLQNSIETESAQKEGVTGVYQITTSRDIRLDYHDIFKRTSDGQLFRVTSKDENATPASATLNMRVVMAEEFSKDMLEGNNG